MKLVRILTLIVLSTALINCSSGGDGGDKSGGAPVNYMSAEKLNAITQAQGAVGQFGSTVKSSKQKKTHVALEIANLFLAQSGQSGKSEQNAYTKTVSEKSQKIYSKFSTANCLTNFRSGQQKNNYQLEGFMLTVAGADCPLKMSYILDLKVESEGNKATGQLTLNFESLNDELSNEIDLKNLTATLTFSFSTITTNERTTSTSEMKMASQGETVSLGAYSSELTVNMNSETSYMSQSTQSNQPNQSNPFDGQSTGPNQSNQFDRPEQMIVSVTIAISGKITSGGEFTEFLGKGSSVNGKDSESIFRVNGADVSPNEFIQKISSLKIGFKSDSQTGDSDESAEGAGRKLGLVF